MNRFVAFCAALGLLVCFGSAGFAQPNPRLKPFNNSDIIKKGVLEKDAAGKPFLQKPSQALKDMIRMNRIAELTNQERTKAGLKPLRVSALLDNVAQAHAANMARQKNMNHKLDGKGPAERLSAAGYAYQTYAENIAYGYSSPEEVVRGWMNSPGHRANILNPNVTEIGVGTAKSSDQTPYYCQVFGKPR